MRRTRLSVLLIFALTMGACRASVRATRTDFDHGRVTSITFLGVRADDAIVWLESTTPRGAAIVSVSIHNGSKRSIARTDGVVTDAWIQNVENTHGWRRPRAIGRPQQPATTFVIDDEVELLVTRPETIAAYGAADVRLVMNDESVSIAELVFTNALVVGPVYRVGDRAILVVRDGALESLRILDLTEARGTLDNLVAIKRLRAGDIDGAATLLERAVARDPTSADSLYNLACVHAVGGDLDRAEAELAIAVALSKRRFSALARRDGDLAALRARPSVQRLIGD